MMASAVLWDVIVGGLRMQLRESRGPNYTSVFWVAQEPDRISITHLGCDQRLALHTFGRKVECHRMLADTPIEEIA